MAYTQEDRLIAIETPLGKDALLLAGFRGTEGISSLFHFDLDILSENHSVVFEDIIGKNVTVSMIMTDGSPRLINGIISSFCQERGSGESGTNSDLSFYTATMVPWLWLLTRSANSRIFQKLSVPDIVEKIFEEKGFQDYKLSLHASYDKRDYCVQYRETDFNFISRLLEDEGICYFFKHEKGKHTLVLADTAEDFQPCPKQESARYQLTTGGWLDEDVIISLEKRQEITASKYSHTDYNFKTPTTDLKVELESKQALAPQELEIYDYPGEYDNRALGETRSNLRMQEEEAKITTITGSSNCRAFTSGNRFDLDGYYRDDMNNKAFVLTYIDHVASVEDSYVTGAGQGEFAYSNNFTCTPFDVPFRPPRITPKPVVQGTQTAIVTGPAGETIYPDKYGRVKIKFHWDRENNNDDKSSCWVRVSQAWAGQGWGSMHIPHVGQEVIVDFFEGDPDRPHITGRLYHANNMPADALPGEKTKSVFRDHGGNEQIIEGKDGAQSIHTKQACGNEFKMDGSSGGEKIELRDKYGNEIVLDAVAGTVRIYSPTHESEIVLGKSGEIRSDSRIRIESGANIEEEAAGNKLEHIVGDVQTNYDKDVIETFVGAFHKNVLGITSKLIGGWKQETIIGAETKSINGAKSETIRGAVFKKHMGKEYKKNESGFHEKTPNALWMVTKAFGQYKESRAKIKEKIEEVETKKIEKAKEYITQFEDRFEKSKSWETKCSVAKFLDMQEYIIEGAEQKIKASKKWGIKTPNAKIKASEVKLG